MVYSGNFIRYLPTLLALNIELPLGISSGRVQGSFRPSLYYSSYSLGSIEAMMEIPEFSCFKLYADWDNYLGSWYRKFDVLFNFEGGLVYRPDRKGKALQKRSLKLIARRSPLLTVDFYAGFDFNKLMVANASKDCIYNSFTRFPSMHILH